MRDRQPTPGKENRVRITQDNGKIVEGVLSYADGATVQGSAYCKANVLPDDVCDALGIDRVTSEPADMFNMLAHIGDLHVWRRTFTADQGKDAWYTLGDKITGTFRFGAFVNYNDRGYARYMFSDTLSVNHDGTFDLSDPSYITPQLSDNDASICNNKLRGKFVKRTNDVPTGFDKNEIYFIPDDATFTFKNSTAGLDFQYINVDKYQRATGHPAIPPGESVIDYPVSTNRNAYTEGTSAGTTIEYLGNLGEKVRMQIVSYVGTGTYGASNPVRVTFDFKPKLVIIHGWMGSGTGTGYNSEAATAVIPYNSAKATLNLAASSALNMNIVWKGKTVSWYADNAAGLQANQASKQYIVTAIG